MTDSQIAHDQNNKQLNHHVFVYDIDDNKQTQHGRMFARIDTGIPDGLAVDDKGNI